MNNLILNTPDNRPIKITGMASTDAIKLSTGKHTATTFTLKTHLRDRLLGCGLSTLSFLIYEGLLFLFHNASAAATLRFLPAFFSIMAVLTALAVKKSPFRGVHGAEHMAVRALETRQPFTKALMAQQSIISKTCGSLLIPASFLWGITATLLLSLPVILPVSTAFTLKLLVLAGVIIWCSLACLMFKQFNLWVQKTFFVSLPTKAQFNLAYEQGLALIQQYNTNPHRQGILSR